MEAKKWIAQAKCSMMTTGGEQEEVVDLRIQEIIGEVALTGVQSDAPGAPVSVAPDKESDPLPGT